MKKDTEENSLDKKSNKLTGSDRAFGHGPLLCNDLGVCSGRQKKNVRQTDTECMP